jgi:hypothetical protein
VEKAVETNAEFHSMANVRKDFVTKCTWIQQAGPKTRKLFMENDLDYGNHISAGFVTPCMQPSSPPCSQSAEGAVGNWSGSRDIGLRF